ncbi:hypothetical protein GCM10010358_25700 [Streptomyces minutiscleroticus]|uniref:Uncharacterized protein n=1 Tax=Streptomyces minutiscleroticus TaxID=68238 RepID=A0A918KQU3_9ACTN|nr:hypothetical protein GCM10010358_25700 [Streptomyces minutiscleroticus]
MLLHEAAEDRVPSPGTTPAAKPWENLVSTLNRLVSGCSVRLAGYEDRLACPTPRSPRRPCVTSDAVSQWFAVRYNAGLPSHAHSGR